MRGAKLVSKRSFSAFSTGLFACACAPAAVMVSEACRTSVRLVVEVVHPAHSGIDHSDAGLDEAKPFQRDVGGLAINEPRAKDAEQAQADEQHGKRNGGKANCLLDDWHPGFRCSFQVKAWLLPNERWAGLPRPRCPRNSA
jgi:hypothetical protein